MTGPEQPIDPGPPPSDATAPDAGPPRPSTPAPEDDRVAALAAYLRSNRGRFTDEALARASADAGYSPAEIASARSLAEDRGWETTAAARSPVNRGVVAVVAIAYVLILYLLISGTASMSSDLSGTVGLVGLVAGVIAWALLRNERPSLARGIGCGVVLAVAIPIVVILVVIGICVVSGTFPSGR